LNQIRRLLEANCDADLNPLVEGPAYQKKQLGPESWQLNKIVPNFRIRQQFGACILLTSTHQGMA